MQSVMKVDELPQTPVEGSASAQGGKSLQEFKCNANALPGRSMCNANALHGPQVILVLIGDDDLYWDSVYH